jgi:hypothetical protein
VQGVQGRTSLKASGFRLLVRSTALVFLLPIGYPLGSACRAPFDQSHHQN